MSRHFRKIKISKCFKAHLYRIYTRFVHELVLKNFENFDFPKMFRHYIVQYGHDWIVNCFVGSKPAAAQASEVQILAFF